jgi:hypothetical protein
MKLRNIALPILVLAFIMYGCGNNLLEFMADKDSTEAVEFDTSQDMDDGKYDAVVNNENASPLDKSAAYLGLAGLDFSDILEKMIDADQEEDDLALYFENLLPAATLENKQYIQNAINQLLPEGAGTVDADLEVNFHYGIAVIMDAILDFKNLVDGGGQNLLMQGIDSDGNGVVDVVEAAECALEFVAVADDDVNNNPLTSAFLDNSPDTYSCENNPNLTLDISAPSISGDTTPLAVDFIAEWDITPDISGETIAGFAVGAVVTVSGNLPPYDIETDILVSYGELGDFEIPLVARFGTNLRETIRSLSLSLPNNPDNSMIEAMEMLWNDINSADSTALADCGFTLPVTVPVNTQDSVETGRITAIEMAAYLLCNFKD